MGERRSPVRVARLGGRGRRVKAYWFLGDEWSGSIGNFGDWLTPYFIGKLRPDIAIEWASPREADTFGCGSIVEAIPEGFRGMILTSGIMHESTERPDLRQARILALRGRLTAERIGLDVPLGDLGLLCRLIAPKLGKEYETGIIRHYVGGIDNLPGRGIDIRAGIEEVIREAAKCQRIVSSSLHGIILADALGIENKWESSDRVYGKGFKFRDYASALGEGIEPGAWRLGNQKAVAEIVAGLRKIIEEL